MPIRKKRVDEFSMAKMGILPSIRPRSPEKYNEKEALYSSITALFPEKEHQQWFFDMIEDIISKADQHIAKTGLTPFKALQKAKQELLQKPENPEAQEHDSMSWRDLFRKEGAAVMIDNLMMQGLNYFWNRDISFSALEEVLQNATNLLILESAPRRTGIDPGIVDQINKDGPPVN